MREFERYLGNLRVVVSKDERLDALCMRAYDPNCRVVAKGCMLFYSRRRYYF